MRVHVHVPVHACALTHACASFLKHHPTYLKHGVAAAFRPVQQLPALSGYPDIICRWSLR